MAQLTPMNRQAGYDVVGPGMKARLGRLFREVSRPAH